MSTNMEVRCFPKSVRGGYVTAWGIFYPAKKVWFAWCYKHASMAERVCNRLPEPQGMDLDVNWKAFENQCTFSEREKMFA